MNSVKLHIYLKNFTKRQKKSAPMMAGNFEENVLIL